MPEDLLIYGVLPCVDQLNTSLNSRSASRSCIIVSNCASWRSPMETLKPVGRMQTEDFVGDDVTDVTQFCFPISIFGKVHFGGSILLGEKFFIDQLANEQQAQLSLIAFRISSCMIWTLLFLADRASLRRFFPKLPSRTFSLYNIVPSLPPALKGVPKWKLQAYGKKRKTDMPLSHTKNAQRAKPSWPSSFNSAPL